LLTMNGMITQGFSFQLSVQMHKMIYSVCKLGFVTQGNFCRF